MAKTTKLKSNQSIPIFVEKDEDGFYVVECPLFEGCFTQGKTLDTAINNIKDVIDLLLKEKENKEILKSYAPKEVSLHTIKL
ncbi:MAG: type II toxin-antitoxin system HicB family antitoxin [Candidatus Paceibacterota bacterium]